jgi:hypothetical protein
MRGFRGKLFVRQKLVPTGSPVLQSDGILHEEVTDVTFERLIYHETKPFQFYQLEIPLKDDRLRVCRFKDDHVFVCFISINDSEEFIRGSDWTGKLTDMQCPVCQREFSRRDNILRHHRNVHAGESRRVGGGSGRGGESGGGGGSRGGGGGRGGDEGKSIDRKLFLFRHPFTANITGQTGGGKTHFAKTLLQNCRSKMAPTPQRIIWL